MGKLLRLSTSLIVLVPVLALGLNRNQLYKLVFEFNTSPSIEAAFSGALKRPTHGELKEEALAFLEKNNVSGKAPKLETQGQLLKISLGQQKLELILVNVDKGIFKVNGKSLTFDKDISLEKLFQKVAAVGLDRKFSFLESSLNLILPKAHADTKDSSSIKLCLTAAVLIKLFVHSANSNLA